ncbi:transposase [Zunongwangia sp. F117]|uniref:Transposase n=1 Tax=Autumnicola musiva TaxID=3075589 RepID=A0ABU3D1N0_9FLAO|nr:transposase [Zunongwangia sp. F117]MDT0675448.1 transposase [Zunongwangia sp. F117]
MKQFKSGDELNGFLKQFKKRGIEKMLEGELDGHLGYNKNYKFDNLSARYGFGQKMVQTSFGESQIQVPRDRNALPLIP